MELVWHNMITIRLLSRQRILWSRYAAVLRSEYRTGNASLQGPPESLTTPFQNDPATQLLSLVTVEPGVLNIGSALHSFRPQFV
jgi:hypothetical protein